MKTSIFIFIILSLFVGCSVLDPIVVPEELLSEDPEEVGWWIIRNIEFKEDLDLYGHLDYWASPKQTLENMAGDCEDQAILFLHTMYTNTGKMGYYEIYWIPSAGSYHMVGVFGDYKYGYIPEGRYIKKYAYSYVGGLIGYYSDRD